MAQSVCGYEVFHVIKACKSWTEFERNNETFSAYYLPPVQKRPERPSYLAVLAIGVRLGLEQSGERQIRKFYLFHHTSPNFLRIKSAIWRAVTFSFLKTDMSLTITKARKEALTRLHLCYITLQNCKSTVESYEMNQEESTASHNLKTKGTQEEITMLDRLARVKDIMEILENNTSMNTWIDRIARVIFPLGYTVFIICYFLSYSIWISFLKLTN